MIQVMMVFPVYQMGYFLHVAMVTMTTRMPWTQTMTGAKEMEREEVGVVD